MEQETQYGDFLSRQLTSMKKATVTRWKNKAKIVIQLWLHYLEQQMLKPKSGHIYPLPGGRKYQASAPDEFPAIKTGNLFENMKGDYEITDSGSLEVWVYVDEDKVPYAEDLDKIRPLFSDAKEDLIDLLDNVLRYKSSPSISVGGLFDKVDERAERIG